MGGRADSPFIPSAKVHFWGGSWKLMYKVYEVDYWVTFSNVKWLLIFGVGSVLTRRWMGGTASRLDLAIP